MNRSKGFLVISSIVGIFLVVYGTSILFRFLFGNYFMDKGLSDVNYLYLALLCSVPYVLYLLLSGRHSERASKVFLTSGLLFLILFVPVHSTLVVEGKELTQETLTRILTVIPLSAFLLVIVCHFLIAGNKNK
ncbi:hypothetical protein PB1_10454 [Bacillus methanolicus PB1]|uniref:Uncharacterized protein n=1 Tax=Bacillus methanolicus PB1 TaxID=997296 RepID=I3DUR2_BACMT|nr:hypothetical protein [Bacillus methanolicus]EIJ77983.1 hypothetical protein PB1_10454 [Bacillus methanolicus PB1]